MKILALQKHIVILDKKQLSQIKGGNQNEGSDDIDIIVITDDDII